MAGGRGGDEDWNEDRKAGWDTQSRRDYKSGPGEVSRARARPEEYLF